MNAKILSEKYPKMFDKNDEGRCCNYRWVATNEGWDWLILNLCKTIQSYIDQNKHLNITQIKIDQIKEKMGGLRFYISGGDETIRGMIWFAESLSYEICEKCGEKGELRNKLPWIVTLCNKHYQEKIVKWKNIDVLDVNFEV